MVGAEPSGIYAVTVRGRTRVDEPPLLEAWYYPMQVGQSLPTLPIWLDEDLSVPLNLETSYEETCRVLRIA